MPNKPKYVAQGLLESWKFGEVDATMRTPLEHYLRYNYEERYVKLCRRLGAKPCTFGAWLRKPISSIV